MDEFRPEEVAFAELALAVPSSAGFFLDEAGQLVVVVRDQRENAEAVAVTRSIVNSRLRSADARTATIRVQPGAFTFLELARLRDAVFDHVLGRVDGVVELDLDEAHNRVRVGLSRSVPASIGEEIVQMLRGIGADPAGLSFVQVSHSAEASTLAPLDVHVGIASAAARSTNIEHGNHWATLAGGVPIVWNEYNPAIPGYVTKACTLGVVADRGSVRGAVTASHCSNEYWGLESSLDPRIFQPDTLRPVAVEHTDPGGWMCWVPLLFECRRSDASFFSFNSGVSSERGLIPRTTSSAGPFSGNGTVLVNQQRPYFIIDAVDDGQMVAGQLVHKIGATTGWTWGAITNTCVDKVNSKLPFKLAQCLYESNMTVDGGDSGAPVLALYGSGYNQNNDLVRLVGIVKGANDLDKLGTPDFRSTFSKWSRVVLDLGAMNVTRGTVLANPALIGGLTGTSASLSWSGVSGATKYQLFRETNGVLDALGVTTALSTADGSSNMIEYTGATAPSSGMKIRYFVRALNATDVSQPSNSVWCRGAAGTFNVTIDGPTVVGPNNAHCGSWQAQVSGADTIVSYTWSGHFSSTSSGVQGSIPESGAEFQVVVLDSQDRQGTYVIQVAYDPQNMDMCV